MTPEPGDSFDAPDGDQYSLVMPFVVCRSQGGPYDDDSFVAGVVFGQHNAQLERGGVIDNGVIKPGFPVPTPLVAQLDLLAMSHSYTLTAEPVDGMDEWTQVTYTPNAEEQP